MQGELHVITEKEQQIPGSVQYRISRFYKPLQRNFEEAGMMVYNYRKSEPKESYLELRFCISGNVYCRHNEAECEICKERPSVSCKEKMETVDVLSFRFSVV